MTSVNDWRKYKGSYIEAYEVVRAFEVVGENRQTYRIEILRALAPLPPTSDKPYSARYSVRREGAWYDQEAGWVAEETDDDAAWRAFGFLAMATQRDRS